MSQVFILVTLAGKHTFTFGDPILNWIKINISTVQTLDIDNFSDDFLITQACRLVEAAETNVVYFKIENPDAALGASFRILETMLQNPDKGNVFLRGEHRQLRAILKARPNIKVDTTDNEIKLREELLRVFSE